MIERRPATRRPGAPPERRRVTRCTAASPGGTLDEGIDEFGGFFGGAGATTEHDSNARSETHGVDDMRAFIGHTAWKAAPSAHIELDAAADLLTVSCYPHFPDVEIDPSSALSVAFHRYRDEYILTSLCLYGAAGWSESPAADTPAADDRLVARRLLRHSIGNAVENLIGGGNGTLELPVAEAAELLLVWRQFVHANADKHDPTQP